MAVKGRLGPIAAVLVLVGVFMLGAGLGKAHGFDLADMFRGHTAPPGEFPVLEPSRPTRIAIPDIDVRAMIRPVGLAADGSIDTPPLRRLYEAGWYDQSPTPGQYGPAIIVGHVDSKERPSVFHRLHELRAGARIEVNRRDGRVAIFEVNSVEKFDKRRLPARVYDDFSRPGLRVITCGGPYVGGDVGYADNIVVFASLIDTRRY